MSLRHLKSTITTSCLVIAAALSTTSAQASQSGLASPQMPQPEITEHSVAIRASGRLAEPTPVAYRASGRFNSGLLGNSLLSYRGSERGVETLAYRASGRFDSGLGNRQISQQLGQGEETLAYRASGRFQGVFERQLISYRGSERGVETLS
jgi:hypothetical protein